MKLNITNKTYLGVCLNSKYYICNESVNFINSFDSFHEAYNNCTRLFWVLKLLSMCDLFNTEITCSKEYIEYDEQEEDSIEYVKKEISLLHYLKSTFKWEKLEPILIEKGILI